MPCLLPAIPHLTFSLAGMLGTKLGLFTLPAVAPSPQQNGHKHTIGCGKRRNSVKGWKEGRFRQKATTPNSRIGQPPSNSAERRSFASNGTNNHRKTPPTSLYCPHGIRSY